MAVPPDYVDSAKAALASAEALVDRAVAELQRGNAAAGRILLEEAITSGRLDPPPWLLLAQACRLMGDDDSEGAALDRALVIAPGNLRAALMRADLFARRGDTQAASAFYLRVGQIAATAGAVDADLPAGIERARQWCEDMAAKYQAHLYGKLAEAGHGVRTLPRRFRESLEILTGVAEVHVQRPTNFYYPQLPQIQFYDRQAFPWLEAVEAAVPAMLAELAGFTSGTAFAPYVVGETDRPRRGHSLLDDPSWSAAHLWQNGKPTEHAAHFPRTLAALADAPLPRIRNRSPMVLLSRLRPHTHIEAHNGMLNSRLIVHVPLIVPRDCRLRVGNDTRTVVAGQAWVFDDSIEHEAWNDSDETRTILLFEIWRPELSEDERAALTALYEAIDSYGS